MCHMDDEAASDFKTSWDLDLRQPGHTHDQWCPLCPHNECNIGVPYSGFTLPNAEAIEILEEGFRKWGYYGDPDGGSP